MAKDKKSRLSAEDIEFMKSLNAAVLQKSSGKMNRLLYIMAALVIIFIAWANLTYVDELTRGQGKVIPTHQIQVVQNLEGGIVRKLLVREGDHVKQGQVLLEIDDTGFGSSFKEGESKYYELKVRIARLQAEASGKPMSVDPQIESNYPNLVSSEISLYNINRQRLESELMVLQERLSQKQTEYSDAQNRIKNLTQSKSLIQQEMSLTKPLYEKGLVSEVEYIQLRQRLLENQNEIESLRNTMSSALSKIAEAKSMINEQTVKFRSEAQDLLSQNLAELNRTSATRVALEDRVKRTQVRSPVDGTVKQMMVNTVGGVVRPGMDILEIVPAEGNLLVEAKVKPSDIAFIYPGQEAIVKFTAYDFAIYGGLKGKVTHISADTIEDEKKESYYLVRVKTDQGFLGDEHNKKDIMVGMTAMVDIVTGKKTVMQYLLKPILRAKYNALRER
ncbi:HlyD family type I secretion periplasmic adaptor subunit [Seleniivibrio woodruffii]|uniref:Adhesin transport system membrane fusion protein n=1 Tax=Seleniivibrio woodruffii TaxID=1078050 RepID=A0A4R1K753_9BACT|nr:HlyD family type I secretion periplasmic adaptor subunit [Seleniivibrio woodruffii]TCK60054.1 adhesin transport system membrane fusion protein [Seleniivibrio woodruffii]TVZ35723.1 adhesin transport system membrane fusion protein [Seleniivibrio woodruffii]